MQNLIPSIGERTQDRNRGRVDQRDNHYDYNNNMTDHQVNFCKIESLDVD